jgi:hypothetical protein
MLKGPEEQPAADKALGAVDGGLWAYRGGAIDGTGKVISSRIAERQVRGRVEAAVGRLYLTVHMKHAYSTRGTLCPFPVPLHPQIKHAELCHHCILAIMSVLANYCCQSAWGVNVSPPCFLPALYHCALLHHSSCSLHVCSTPVCITAPLFPLLHCSTLCVCCTSSPCFPLDSTPVRRRWSAGAPPPAPSAPASPSSGSGSPR